MMRIWKTLALMVLIALVGYMYVQRHAGVASISTAPDDTPAPRSQTTSSPSPQLPAFLPPEARATLALIARDGPFPHPQDGEVFGNYEGLLPREPRGYYHEYTVDTPGLNYRGTRRIISGGNPPLIYYYTDDHYRTFRAFEVLR